MTAEVESARRVTGPGAGSIRPGSVSETGGRIGRMAQRNTRQRERVRAALAGSPGFVSAQSLYATLRTEETGIGLATVYRALAGLAAQGDVDTLQSPDGEALYRACASSGHHHHLICRSCGRTVEIEATAVEQWARATAEAHGFSDAEHIVDIFGLCAVCAARAEAGSAAPRTSGA